VNKISPFFFLLFSLAFGQKGERSQLIIPPKQIVQINYPLYQGFNVKIWNKSKFDLGVSARERKTDSLVKGFGLDSGSSAVFEVNKGLYLQFENRYLAPLKVEYILQKGVKGKKKPIKPLTPQRAFYLENNTAQSIPLRIPGVMNPNLSPFSRSGVDLPNGQNIFLDLNGKRILILTVTDSIPHGARIDVATLIEKALNNP
jgi:hypothetical protein